MSAEWGPGTVILGRYRLDTVLGRGGMGSVWRAEHLQLRAPVAVKLLDSAISSDQQMLARFMREAQSAASLRSPHVVQIFDYGVEDGIAFIAMEMLQGESLAERLARLKTLPAEEVIRFLSQVLRAIGKAHEAGIVHRDLKPDNIFICADDPEFAKVLDFGVAKVTNGALSGAAGSRTQTGMMIGTPYYMSPEQTQAKEVDPRADLWGIAVIAYECLVGRKPFTGDSFGELVIAICTKPVPVPSQQATVPPGFDEWFVKGTQRDRARRFGSAREMADELAKLGDGRSAGVSRSQFATARNPVAVPLPRPGATPARASARVDELDLTTGQRAVTSESLNHPRVKRSPAVYALIAVAVLIVVGVGAFVASGGASAFNKSALGPESAAASMPALTVTPPLPATPLVVPTPAPVPTPVVSTAINAPVAAAPVVASAGPVVPELARPAPKSAASPKGEPAKKASAPASAAPSKDPLPPKNWEF